MALDRLIVITHQPPGFRDPDGNYVSPPPVDYRVWSERRDLDARDIEESGGVRAQINRDYRIRWRSEIAAALTSELSFTSEDGLAFNVTNVIEETNTRRRDDAGTRRQWLRIQAVHTT